MPLVSRRPGSRRGATPRCGERASATCFGGCAVFDGRVARSAPVGHARPVRVCRAELGARWLVHRALSRPARVAGRDEGPWRGTEAQGGEGAHGWQRSWVLQRSVAEQGLEGEGGAAAAGKRGFRQRDLGHLRRLPTRNARGAPGHGDVVRLRTRELLRGVCSAAGIAAVETRGVPPGTVRESARRVKRGEPQDRLRDATSPRACGGGSRRDGAKP